MSDLTFSLIQTPLYWQNIDANLAMLEEKIWQIQQPTDIIVLPETFTTGFTNEAKGLAEPLNSKTHRWMQQQAAQSGAAITGSFIAREGTSYYNRLLWVEPNGSFQYYDKKHLFRMSKEHDVYSSGSQLLIVDYKGWRICPLVCYDLRFPVWSRNRLTEDNSLNYDLLIYVANWPAPRASAWNTLLHARAAENLSYVIGVNRIEEDGNQIPYAGDSQVIDYKGDTIEALGDQDAILTKTISKKDLNDFRQKFPAYLDADSFNLD